MPTIRIDDEVWRFLQSKARPFEDTPNDVLRRVCGLAAPADAGASIGGSSADTGRAGGLIAGDDEYTNTRISAYRFGGRQIPVRTFKDLLVNFSNDLRAQFGEKFDKVALGLHGRTRSYFSQDVVPMKFPVELRGGLFYVETNLNANLIVSICRTLLSRLGRDPNELKIE